MLKKRTMQENLYIQDYTRDYSKRTRKKKIKYMRKVRR